MLTKRRIHRGKFLWIVGRILLPKDLSELRARKIDLDMSNLHLVLLSDLIQPVVHTHKITMRDFEVVLTIINIKASIVSGHASST